MARPDLNGLRALALSLPPSERVQGGEVADVLSSLVALATHGAALLEAAQEGTQQVYEFYHTKAVDKAKADGTPVPARGSTFEEVPRVAPVAQAPTIDYDKLAAAIVAQQKSADVTASEASDTSASPDNSEEGVSHAAPSSEPDNTELFG